MKKPVILVVEDQISSQMLLKAQLTEYDIITATTGYAAIKILDKTKPDLILLDVMMPGMDGYSVLSIIKSTRDTRHIPVILVTSLTGTEDKIKSWEKGADDIIAKPINPLELRGRIQSLLRMKSSRNDTDDVVTAFFSLVQASENKCAFSANHTKHVSYYAEQLARRVLPSTNDSHQIYIAALLHDIGKIAIQEALLLKSTELQVAEYAIIKTHPVISEQICSSIASFKELLPMIRHHHESYDGTGYPDRLKGADIPLGARVLAIADSFEALTKDRPYRKAYPVDQALAILRERAGIQWDPGLVFAFIDLMEANKIQHQTGT